MSIVKRKPVAIETLAANLDLAAANRKDAIVAAEERYASERQSVIDQGTQRAQELRRLEAEAAAEAAKAEDLVAVARDRK